MSDQNPELEPTPDLETSTGPTKKSYESKVMGNPVRTGLPPRTIRRLTIMGVILAGVCYCFYWFVGQKGDFQLPSDTSKMIAALQQKESGSEAVVLEGEGKVKPASGYAEGNSDRDLAWDPKGNRLFFISDRRDNGFHIFRWDPQRDSLDQKSIDRASRSELVFDSEDTGVGDLVGLVIVRGTVQEFTPKVAKSQQVMPPTKRTAGGEEGSVGNFEMMYKRFGQSFKSARWFHQRRYIAAVMRREDKGECLIVQDMEGDEKGNFRPPQLLFNAQKITLAVNPKNGELVFSIVEALPFYDEEGKILRDPNGNEIVVPFTHGIFHTIEKDGKLSFEPVGIVKEKGTCFTSPVVSPDGNTMMFLAAKYLGEGNMEIQSLDVCPMVSNGIQGHTPLVNGNITDPAFSPDGRKIAYIKQDGGHQAVFIANSDGGDAKNLTGSTGDYATPIFSPQYKE